MLEELGLAIERDGAWWIGWLEAVPGVIAQELSKDELLISLQQALADIRDLDLQGK